MMMTTVSLELRRRPIVGDCATRPPALSAEGDGYTDETDPCCMLPELRSLPHSGKMVFIRLEENVLVRPRFIGPMHLTASP